MLSYRWPGWACFPIDSVLVIFIKMKKSNTSVQNGIYSHWADFLGSACWEWILLSLNESPNEGAVRGGLTELKLSAYFGGTAVLLSSGGLDFRLGSRRAAPFPWAALGTKAHSPYLFKKRFWSLSLKDWTQLLRSWQLCFHVSLWNVMFVKIKFPEYHWKLPWKFILILALRHGLIWSEVVQGLWWKR